jgi:AAA+ ATPase superfamily predicted ATPase
MEGFVGREVELGRLDALLEQVRTGGRTGRPGRAVLIRGRRRVGKSRLVEEFLERGGLPHVYVTATGHSRQEDLDDFAREVAASSLPGAATAADFGTPATWNAAFTLLAAALESDGPESPHAPSVVVLDEMPYLAQEDPAFEGALQKAFDRTLSRLPVLLILVGSDIAMMEALNTYGRPLYQRGTEMLLPPLNPSEVGRILDLPAADAFDAYLVTGGLPLILEEWPRGASLRDYLRHALTTATSALLVSGERTLAAEFPTGVQARTVLGAIGHGERTFTLIGRAAGDLHAESLRRSLEILTGKGMVAAELPLSTRPSRETRYRVADSYLRFWLSFVGPRIPVIERGRGDRVLEQIRTSWTSWRGRAIEPVIREALWRLADDELPEGTDAVGGYWTRTNDPEIDVVGADRAPVAKRITAVGSIKWLETKPFDARDLARLIVHRSRLPGADEATPLVAVARGGCAASGVRWLGPEELLSAWS